MGFLVAACFFHIAIGLRDLFQVAKDFVGWLYIVHFPVDGYRGYFQTK